jgi:hypothetical protein
MGGKYRIALRARIVIASRNGEAIQDRRCGGMVELDCVATLAMTGEMGERRHLHVARTHVSLGLGTSIVTGAVPPPLRPRGRLPSGLGSEAPDAARNLPERGVQPVAADLAG